MTRRTWVLAAVLAAWLSAEATRADDVAKEAADLKGHSDQVTGVAFSPDGKTLAVGLGDGSVKLWQLNLK